MREFFLPFLMCIPIGFRVSVLAINYQLVAINYQGFLSTIKYQLSTINYQLTIFKLYNEFDSNCI